MKQLNNSRIKMTLVVIVLVCLFGVGFIQGRQSKIEAPLVPSPVVEQVSVPPEQSHPYIVEDGTTLYSSLREHEVPAPVIHQIVTAAKPVFDLAKLRAGIRYQITRNEQEEVDSVEFRFSPSERLLVKRTGEDWSAEKLSEKIDIRIVTFQGNVQTTLWESAGRAAMDPNLIIELSEIFAWQVDFAREMRVNSRWRLTVEQRLVKGQPMGWGSILAAELENDGRKFSAVLHRVDGEPKGYFAADGSSMKRMFLKSPISFARISSRFAKKRFHPIEQIDKPHLGVDYAAATGTPVKAVGDGVIVMAGWNGKGGNTIKLRHNSTYTTAYLHLSKVAVKSGASVKQGQVIGYVGTTGASTGPHLHFEFLQAGTHVDPLGKDFPAADPIAPEMMAQFQQEALPLLAALPEWQSLEVSQHSSVSPVTTIE